MMTGDQVHEIFRKIANGERKHGGFLTKFAEAYMMADPENELLLLPAALALIAKYPIAGYADEPPETSPIAQLVEPEKL